MMLLKTKRIIVSLFAVAGNFVSVYWAYRHAIEHHYWAALLAGLIALIFGDMFRDAAFPKSDSVFSSSGADMPAREAELEEKIIFLSARLLLELRQSQEHWKELEQALLAYQRATDINPATGVQDALVKLSMMQGV